jgi:hypothetical protein
MKVRFLTLLTTLAFFGFTVCAFAGPPDKCFPWPSCKPYSGDGEDLYTVTISGEVPGGGPLWQYDGRSIDFPAFHRPIGADAELNLDFFENLFNSQDSLDPARGTRCFSGWGDPLNSAGVLKRRKSDAHGKFWFRGSTHHISVADRKQVLYLLIVDGDFADGPEGWPENGGSLGGNYMDMTDWELKVENEGTDIAGMSCEGSGSFNDDGFYMEVFVDPSPPPSD